MRRAGTVFFLCWMLLVGSGLFYSLKSAITGEPVPGQDADVRDMRVEDSGVSVAAVTDSLTALDDLRRAGLLSDEEYFHRRDSLMKSL